MRGARECGDIRRILVFEMTLSQGHEELRVAHGGNRRLQRGHDDRVMASGSENLLEVLLEQRIRGNDQGSVTVHPDLPSLCSLRS
jgi:hypothetical protein